MGYNEWRLLYGEDPLEFRCGARFIVSSGEAYTKKIVFGLKEGFIIGPVLLAFIISKFVIGQVHCSQMGNVSLSAARTTSYEALSKECSIPLPGDLLAY